MANLPSAPYFLAFSTFHKTSFREKSKKTDFLSYDILLSDTGGSIRYKKGLAIRYKKGSSIRYIGPKIA